jgi:signal peptidase
MTATTMTDASAEASTHTSEPGSAEETEPRGGIWRALGTGISVGILAIIIGLAAVTVIVPHFTGATPLTVLTGSMEPHLPPGTLLVVKPVKPADIHIGDVVTYEPNPNDATTVISHRVIGIANNTDGTRTFTVQGDANNAPDAPVMQKQVVAKLWYSVPLMGWVNSWVSGTHRAWAIPVAAAALFCYAAWNFASGLLERKRRGPRGRRRAA